jgi:serine/threonine protein kinase
MHNNEQASKNPEEFGPYLVYERLGAGGVATVHRAKKRGIAGYERWVALKRLRPQVADDAEFVDSFVREAKLASLLVHHNIAQVHDFGHVGDVYFIAMEHVEGFDVNTLLRYSHRRREQLPLNVVLAILCDVCEALDYAHTFVDAHGHPHPIVHRDLTPSNLIVAHTGHVKVIDFGIANATRSVRGKLGYMSPEAVLGRELGPPADVFSIGVIAHELLTCQPLFSAKTADETLTRLAELEIAHPSHRNPSVPASLDQLVLAALERIDDHRLQSAGDFRGALERVAIQAGIRVSSGDVAAWLAKISTSPGAAPSTRLPSSRPRTPPPALPPSALPPPALPPPALSASSEGHGWDSFGDSAVVADASDLLPAPKHPITTAPMPRARFRWLAPVMVLVLVTLGVGVAADQFLRGAPDVTVEPARPPASSAHTAAQLKLIIEPPDSVVEIGGKEVSRTSPFEIAIDPGVYSVAVSHAGYKRWTSEITLRDVGSQTINVALEPAIARVHLSSEPGGLVAQLDGRPLAATPARPAPGHKTSSPPTPRRTSSTRCCRPRGRAAPPRHRTNARRRARPYDLRLHWSSRSHAPRSPSARQSSSFPSPRHRRREQSHHPSRNRRHRPPRPPCPGRACHRWSRPAPSSSSPARSQRSKAAMARRRSVSGSMAG